MRIPIWPGVRLSVWEKQNPDAVQVRLTYAQPKQPLRRVLSKRGWMLLLVRYDRKNSGMYVPEPGFERVAEARIGAFVEAVDILRGIDPEGFREAANVCEALQLRAEQRARADREASR